MSWIKKKASDEKRSRSEEEVIDIVNEACHGLKRKQVEGFYRERGEGR